MTKPSLPHDLRDLAVTIVDQRRRSTIEFSWDREAHAQEYDAEEERLRELATVHSPATCPCFGCTINRRRAGIPGPDRSGDPCHPTNACAAHGRCWTHSDWSEA